MEERPPVPPKDTKYLTKMEIDHAPTAPHSGSKRKREPQDEGAYLEPVDSDDQTAERSHSNQRQGDISASEDNSSGKPRLVRRKKGSQNLSNLNLRHAAEQQGKKQASPRTKARVSKFIEGSLTDKPIQKPPSIFLRKIPTNSGNIPQVDELMENYHNEKFMPLESIEQKIKHEKAMIPQRVAKINAANAKQEESKGFFQFGRQFATNFHPVTLWNRLWNESKEELARKDMEEAERKEAERKAQLKAMYEEQYAQMKKAGQFPTKYVGRQVNATRASEDETETQTATQTETPRDSGVAIDDLNTLFEQKRNISAASQLLPPKDDATDRPASEIPDNSGKTLKGFKSRLHLKTPSLSNIKTDLKRVTSDLNLGAAAAGSRQSSSSISPVKTDFENSTLRQSASKHDLKKQNKLSKRVSDLETKLNTARKELDEALVEASPMPKLGNKYERFTPVGTIKRPKFIPSKLPSLPSERILMAEQGLGVNGHGNDNEKVELLPEPRSAMNLSLKEFLAERELDNDQNTIKARDQNPYPARESTLFLQDNGTIEHDLFTNGDQIHKDHRTSNPAKHPSEGIENMDPNSITNGTNDSAAEPIKAADYASLDAKLKALEANVKTARNVNKPKKRKSAAKDDDKTFKPIADSDEDDEFKEATPKKKKRKSNGDKDDSSPPNARFTRTVATGAQSSPKSKKAKGNGSKGDGVSSFSGPKKAGGKQGAIEQTTAEVENAQAGAEEHSTDELAEDQGVLRNSMDSNGRPLDPVYEEEEETTTIQLKDEPSKPTAKATPARHSRANMRSRSASPNKRAGSVQPGTEERMITHAAHAAQEHPGRKAARSVSPPPLYSKVAITEETVSVVPGQDGIPGLPRGANGSFESLDELAGEPMEVEVLRTVQEREEEFEWPEDVF